MNAKSSTGDIRSLITFQFNISWQLLEYHLTGIDDQECLWRPQEKGLHVHDADGVWQADWPESELYDTGPASIAWLTWHILFWWSMVLDHSFGHGTLTRQDIPWPGSITSSRKEINDLRNMWEDLIEGLSEGELLSCQRTKWPFAGRPFHELAAWLNLELMKNAAEIGYCRFLYASQKSLCSVSEPRVPTANNQQQSQSRPPSD